MEEIEATNSCLKRCTPEDNERGNRKNIEFSQWNLRLQINLWKIISLYFGIRNSPHKIEKNDPKNILSESQ